MTGSGLARDAGAMLRRLVVRVALLIGFTAGAWLAGVLFAGPASADVRLPLDVPGINLTGSGSSEQPAGTTKSKSTKAAKPEGQGLLGGLVGGLVGTVTNTVGTTVSTVTTTVSNTVTTVTTTVDKTLGTVTKTVTTVVDGVTKLPDKVLSPPASSGDNSKPLLPEPVTDLLDLGKKSGSTATQTDTQRADAASAAETPVVAPAEAAPLAAEAVTAPADRQHALATQSAAHPVRVGSTSEKAAPADNRPGPLPSPTSPVAPAAPCPTFSSGGNGGSDARGMLAVLPAQAQLVPPSAARLHQQHFVAELGRSAGLPATPPD